MKYQKSMLKIYELLLLNRGPIILEEIIKKASVGRTSGFKAINWLDKNGFIKIRKIGKQKEVSLKRDRYTLQFKNFIDALKFKGLDSSIKYSINIFIDNLKDSNIKSILLFGSSLITKQPKDIDLLIVYSDKINKNEIMKIRNKIEPLTDFVINLHFDNNPSIERLLNSICLFGFEHYIEILVNKNNIYVQFCEAINWLVSAYNNIGNKNLFRDCLDNVIINLGFTYSLINEIVPKTKNEAKTILFKQYRKLNKLERLDNHKKINLIKQVVSEIGKEVFK